MKRIPRSPHLFVITLLLFARSQVTFAQPDDPCEGPEKIYVDICREERKIFPDTTYCTSSLALQAHLCDDPKAERPEEATPGYPNQDPLERPRFVFSATTQPPFDKINGGEIELPVAKGEQAFMVLVVGQDIVGDDGQFQVESAAPGVRVVPIAAKEAEVHPDVNSVEPFDTGFASLTKGWSKDATDWLTSMDAAFVMFDVDGGVLPGAKRFVINGVEGDWILRRGTINAQMIVARSDWIGAHHQTDVVYHHDEITVAVKSSAPLDVDELVVHVLVDGKKAVLVGMRSLILKKGGQGDIFSSVPIRIAPSEARAARMGGPAIVAPEYAQITLVTDFYNEFVSQPSTSLMVYVTPARMHYFPAAPSTTGPKSSYLWKDALQEAANLARKKVDDWDDLSVDEAGKITNFIVTELSSREVKVTVGHHAAMILLRRLFLEQMNAYLYTLPRIPDEKFLRVWREIVRPHRMNPNFGPAQVKVITSRNKDSILAMTMPYGKTIEFVAGKSFIYEGIYERVAVEKKVLDRIDRDAYLGWRQAVIDSIEIAVHTETKEIEDLVKLTGQGFGPVVRMLVPRLVKLQERGSPAQLVWVPDEQARLRVQSIQTVADEALAIDAIGSADTSLVVAVASLGLMAPVTVPTRIMCLAIEVGMAAEAGSQVYDYFESKEAVKFALGASVILNGQRLTEAEARAIPGWSVVLGVVGTVVGLGSETYGLVASMRVEKAVRIATKLLPELEKGGLRAFHALGRNDQLSVLAAITAAKSDQKILTLKFGPERARLNSYGLKLHLEASKLEFAAKKLEDAGVGTTRPPGTGTVPPPGAGTVPPPGTATVVPPDYLAHLALPRSLRAPKSVKLGDIIPVKKIPKTGDAFTIMGSNGPEDIVIGELLGQGRFARVYAIKGKSDRVIKFFKDSYSKVPPYGVSRSSRDCVITAQRVHKLLKDRDIFQLEIRHFAPDVPPGHASYVIQDPLLDGTHIWFDYKIGKRSYDYNGIKMTEEFIDGLKPAKHLTPDGELSPEMQRAILRLYKKLASGPDPLIWEDGHMANVFLVKDGTGYKAGILDHDRIVRFADIQADPDLYKLLEIVEGIPEIKQIESLRHRLIDEHDIDRVFEQRGSLSPSADYFMGKMLEYGARFIRYNRESGAFEKILFDPKIVDEFFPDLKKWVDPDLRYLGDDQSFNTLPIPEIMPWVMAMRIAA